MMNLPEQQIISTKGLYPSAEKQNNSKVKRMNSVTALAFIPEIKFAKAVFINLI